LKLKEGTNNNEDVGVDCEESEVIGVDYEESEVKEDSNREFEGAVGKSKCSIKKKPNSEHQSPTRSTRRPSRYRDDEFETQFRPKGRRQRSCNYPGRGDQGNVVVDNF